MRKLGATELKTVDVGGERSGLRRQYDKLSLIQELLGPRIANDIVSTLGDISEHHGEPHPRIFSESGRALAAHHSVLVFNVLGVHEYLDGRQQTLSAE